MKQVVVQFNFPNVSLQQYDGVWDGLRASGNAHPRGLISHVGAATPDGGLLVVDVWDSEEAFNEFGKTLLPLIARQNISMVSPKIFPALCAGRTHRNGLSNCLKNFEGAVDPSPFFMQELFSCSGSLNNQELQVDNRHSLKSRLTQNQRSFDYRR